MTTLLATDIRKRFRMSPREPDVHVFGQGSDEAVLPTDQEIDLMKAMILEGTMKPPLLVPYAPSDGSTIAHIAWIGGMFQSIGWLCEESDDKPGEEDEPGEEDSEDGKDSEDAASQKTDWDHPKLSADIPETTQFARTLFGQEVVLMFEASGEPVVHIDDIETQYWMVALAQANGMRIEFPF